MGARGIRYQAWGFVVSGMGLAVLGIRYGGWWYQVWGFVV